MNDGEPMEHVVDRTDWPPGPWDDEPNRVVFRVHGLPCFILRGWTGAWNCYVGVVPELAPTLEVAQRFPVHGGVCYRQACKPPVCHVPAQGERDDLIWFGFDCGHAGDLIPMMAFSGVGRSLVAAGVDLGPYRDMAYAREQTGRLAIQLAAFLRRARR